MTMKILLLEDDLLFAMHLREVLEEEGWMVYHEVNATNAKMTLEETSVDVIICDILIRGVNNMPTPDGGLTLMVHTQQHVKPNPVIIAMTGTSESLNLLKLAESMHVDLTMKKPIDVDRLLAYLHHFENQSIES